MTLHLFATQAAAQAYHDRRQGDPRLVHLRGPYFHGRCTRWCVDAYEGEDEPDGVPFIEIHHPDD